MWYRGKIAKYRICCTLSLYIYSEFCYMPSKILGLSFRDSIFVSWSWPWCGTLCCRSHTIYLPEGTEEIFFGWLKCFVSFWLPCLTHPVGGRVTAAHVQKPFLALHILEKLGFPLQKWHITLHKTFSMGCLLKAKLKGAFSCTALFSFVSAGQKRIGAKACGPVSEAESHVLHRRPRLPYS